MVLYCDSNVREELLSEGLMLETFFVMTAMVGKQKGALKLIEEKVDHPIMKLHCIIHRAGPVHLGPKQDHVGALHCILPSQTRNCIQSNHFICTSFNMIAQNYLTAY